MKKKIITFIMVAVMICPMCDCASLERMGKDIGSDISGGIDRTVIVYNANGDVMKTYEGKIDFESTEGGIVKFDLNGKRYMYYNCFVEAIEK